MEELLPIILATPGLLLRYDLDIFKTMDHLLNLNIDKKLEGGLWIWDIEKNIEVYSPRFRKTLGFKNEEDFPNTPESWQKQILEIDLKLALKNYNKHVETKGAWAYNQRVRYWNKKFDELISLQCFGAVVLWEPRKIMIGMHNIN